MYDVTIIGAGIVGLATAMKILEKQPSLKVAVIEKEKDIALHQTGNNSGVIHSGIYYKPGSLKALNCKKGYDLLLEFCKKENIPYRICGKVIVATSENEIEYLDKIYLNGIANGLEGIRKVDIEEIKKIEPKVEGVAGIIVPQTGIIDYKVVAGVYKNKILDLGGRIIFNENVVKIIIDNNHFKIVTSNSEIKTRHFISCAGLHSDDIAKMTNPELDLKIIPFRGEYYKLKEQSRNLVNTLVYPVPDPAFPFLGVHFTTMINGEVEAGPNAVLAFAKEGYKKTDIDFLHILSVFNWKGFKVVAKKYWKTGLGEFYRSFSKKAFVKALQKLIPSIRGSQLVSGGSGIRAQVCDSSGKLLDDFLFVEGKGYLHVCNAPSPAATSSLAIGETNANRILEIVNKHY